MPTHHSGLHHYHKRKRTSPTNKFVRFFDHFIYIVAIVIPLMTIPQVLMIWINKSAQDVSLITWSAYLFSALCWLTYSIIRKDKPLIINSILWVILESLVIVGVIIYG